MNDDVISEISDFLLQKRIQQSELVELSNSQNLVWNIIFFVATNQYKDNVVNVSDVCVSVPGSKDTIMKTINKPVAKVW